MRSRLPVAANATALRREIRRAPPGLEWDTERSDGTFVQVNARGPGFSGGCGVSPQLPAALQADFWSCSGVRRCPYSTPHPEPSGPWKRRRKDGQPSSHHLASPYPSLIQIRRVRARPRHPRGAIAGRRSIRERARGRGTLPRAIRCASVETQVAGTPARLLCRRGEQ